MSDLRKDTTNQVTALSAVLLTLENEEDKETMPIILEDIYNKIRRRALLGFTESTYTTTLAIRLDSEYILDMLLQWIRTCRHLEFVGFSVCCTVHGCIIPLNTTQSIDTVVQTVYDKIKPNAVKDITIVLSSLQIKIDWTTVFTKYVARCQGI